MRQRGAGVFGKVCRVTRGLKGVKRQTDIGECSGSELEDGKRYICKREERNNKK